MALSPVNQFLFEAIFLNAEGLAELSTKLMAEACAEISVEARGEICRKIILVDALGSFKFPGEFPPARRRLAA